MKDQLYNMFFILVMFCCLIMKFNIMTMSCHVAVPVETARKRAELLVSLVTGNII